MYSADIQQRRTFVCLCYAVYYDIR